MAALDFPSSPTNGQTYTANGSTWTYNSATTSWLATNSGLPATLTVPEGGTGLTSLTLNYIPFGNGTSAFGSSSDFTWDNTAKDLRINGQVGIGAAAQANVHFQIGGTAQSGSNTSYVLWNAPTIPSTSTSGAFIFSTYPSTAAAAFTCASIVHFHAFQGTVGAGSTLSNQYGLYIDSSLTGATNNFGVYSAIASGTNRWNLYVAGTASNYLAGRLNLGSTSTAVAAQFYFGGTAPSGSDVYSIYTDQTISSATTGSASAVTSNLSTAAAAFTLPSLNHFVATKGTFGAGSTVTTQRGFYAHNTLTGATNNYGFFSDIAAGTNRYNFYANGTALNFFQGAVGMGAGAPAYTQLRIGGTGPSSSNLTYSVYLDQTAPATTTNEFASFYSIPNTAASAFTLGTLFHFIALQGTIGAGSAVTNQFGFYVGNNLTGATNNYGFYSNIPSGTNRWNIYANGTAANYFNGVTTFASAPIFSSLTGILKGNGASALTVATAGTDYMVPSTNSTISAGVGFAVTSTNQGTPTGGNTLPLSPLSGNYQYLTNNAAFTIQAPSVDGALDVLVTNGASAGAITMSGFTAPTGGGGDTYATTNALKFLLMVRRINGTSTYAWKALQ